MILDQADVVGEVLDREPSGRARIDPAGPLNLGQELVPVELVPGILAELPAIDPGGISDGR